MTIVIDGMEWEAERTQWALKRDGLTPRWNPHRTEEERIAAQKPEWEDRQ